MNHPIYIHFPLSSGETALLVLPSNMEPHDYERLKAMIGSLYPERSKEQ